MIGGTWFVLPTPFAEDGSVDLASQRRVVDLAVSWGVDGLTAMGVTGEAAALTAGEREVALAEVFAAADDRVPVAVGCSAGSAAAVRYLVEAARALGAVAAMVAAPPLAGDVDALPRFFAAAAEPGPPLVVQDEPAVTGVRIPVSVLLRCLEASGARVVKLEDPPTPPKIARLLEADPGLSVFGGLGGVAALAELRNGARGTMTGFAFPEVLRAVREAHEAGDGDRAATVFDRHLPLIQLEAQPRIGLSIRKELLRRRGAIAFPGARLAPPLDDATLAELDDVLRRVGIDPSPEPLRVDG